MKNISIPDGVEEYNLNDRVTVRFNPTDVGFLERLHHVNTRLTELQAELNSAKETLGDDEAGIFALASDLDAQMRAELDSLFDVPICEALFGSINLYASAGGFPVWTNFLLAIAEETGAAMQSELAAREKRIAKYTSKYESEH